MKLQQRTLTTVAALLTATLTLTACGSDSDSASDDKIKGSDQEASDDASESPSVSPDTVDRPKIETPGFTMKFEDWTSSDKTEQAILNDGRERMRSLLAAIIKNEKKPSYLSFYSTGEALSSAQEWVQGFQEKDLTLTGKTRYFGPIIKVIDKKNATLVFCNDQNYGYTKNRKTGKVDHEPSSEDAYVQYKTRLVLNDQGVWQTGSATSTQGKCVG